MIHQGEDPSGHPVKLQEDAGQNRCSVCHHGSLWRITVLVRIRGWQFVGKKIRVRLAYVRRPCRRIHGWFFGRLWFGGQIYSPGLSLGRGVLPVTGRAPLRLEAKGSFTSPALSMAPAVLGLVGA
jgi:hypothetical protein